MYVIPDRHEAESLDTVNTEMILVRHQSDFDLCDPGSTYFCVFPYYTPWLELSWDFLSVPLCASTPMGDSLIVNRVYRSRVVTVWKFDTQADLVLLYLVDLM